MTSEVKSRKGLLVLTLITVLSIVSVITVYAAWIGNFTGGNVLVGGMGSGNIMYSLVNQTGTWSSTLNPSGAGVAWYSRLELDNGGYSGPVTITWKLQHDTGTWTNVTSTNTSIVLSGSAQNVYASSNGDITDNYNWGNNVTSAGTYRVIIEVNST